MASSKALAMDFFPLFFIQNSAAAQHLLDFKSTMLTARISDPQTF
jgi:hypothetical protein